MKVFFLAVAVVITAFGSKTGTELIFSGQILDHETEEGLPFAHIKLNGEVAVTNEDGEFQIEVPYEANYVIEASFIGYENFESTLSAAEEKHVIYLKPAITELEAVVVKTGEGIISEVLNHLKFNYELDHQSMNCYYKERLFGQQNLYYLAEGILDIYLPSDVSSNTTQVSPIRTRKKEYIDVAETDVTMIRGHAKDMVESVVRRDDSFLQFSNLSHYEFSFEGATYFNNKKVYEVSFEPKSKKGRASGKLFIEEGSYAVVKAHYYPDLSKSYFWDEVEWVEEFTQQEEGLWNLNTVKYIGKWTDESEKQFEYESLLVVNESKVVTDPPEMQKVLSDRDTFFQAAGDFSDDFWKGFNFVKLTLGEKSQLSANY
ncbi:MAG: carboxypeptidase-like regulatory domain-containing protein [Cyclobacteriaceae bacterium]|nr:carboxypeptidase-like regulatory domain-containing protein [Cyclobacteriaceae bacterium HetDA_MAG_MS6]